MEKILVYSFDEIQAKGFGARLFDIVNCLVYCESYNAKIAFIENQSIPFYADNWSDIFDWSEFLVLTKSEVESKKLPVWLSTPFGQFGKNNNESNSKNSTKPLNKFFTTAFYAKSVQRLFKLHANVQSKVDTLVDQSGFKLSDWVIHFRFSDKVHQVKDRSTTIESAPHDLKWYWQEVANRIQSLEEKQEELKLNQFEHKKEKDPSLDKLNSEISSELESFRVFICCDSEEALQTLPDIDIEITWDKNEDRSGNYCPQSFQHKITKSKRDAETLTALKNWTIMQRSRFLVGARCSYFYRIAELLHFPKPSKNVKDSDMFGSAEYALQSEKLVRPCKMRCYLNFLTSQPIEEIDRCKQELREKGLTTVYNVIHPDWIDGVYQEIINYPSDWLIYAIKHQHSTQSQPFNFKLKESKKIQKELSIAIKDHENGSFCYSFKRTLPDHSKECSCCVCRLDDTMSSFECLEFFSNLTGINLTGKGETFLSMYQKDDWLSTHHDKDKGKVVFVFNFNKNWCVSHGGALHFVKNHGENNQDIYHTVIPKFNCVNIFILDPNNIKDHFVSQVVCNKNRYAYTGWLN